MTQAALRADAADASDQRVAERLRERYRHPVDLAVWWNTTLDLLLSHRSVRAYLPGPLPDGTVELLVAAA